MRSVLFYLHQYPAFGGIETVTAVIAGALQSLGYEVAILSHVSKAMPLLLEVANGIPVYKMPDVDFTTIKNRNYLSMLVREKDVGLVVFQDSYAPVEKNMRDLPREVNLIVCEHNSPFWATSFVRKNNSVVVEALRYIVYLKNRIRSNRQLARRRFLYERAWRYALLSDRYYGEFRAVTGLNDTRKLMTLHNPLPCDVGYVGGKKNEIVFVGTLDYRKGCDFLPFLFQELSKQLSGWCYTVVGDGPARASVEARLAGMKQVRFLGYQKNPIECYRSARILLAPSRREGWPMVLLEAMSKGCVPVCFDSYSAVRDVLGDSERGLVVPAYDLNEMVRRIVALARNPQMLWKMSAKGMNYVDRFTVRNIMREWIPLVEEACR